MAAGYGRGGAIMRWGAEDYSEWEVKRLRWRRRLRLFKKLGIVAVFLATFWAAWNYLPQSWDLSRIGRRWVLERQTQKPWVFYPNCATARYLGAAPIRRGEPGYRTQLDADNDGIACEPIPPWAR